MKRYSSPPNLSKLRLRLSAIGLAWICLLFSASLIGFGAPSAVAREVAGAPAVDMATNATQTRANTSLPSARHGVQPELSQPTRTLAALDLQSIQTKPHQVGVGRAVELSPDTDGQRVRNLDGSEIIFLTIRARGAAGVRVHFKDFDLATGDEVYVYGTAAESTVSGPYRATGPWDSKEFWSGTVEGDTAIVEFHVKNPGASFTIPEIGHIFVSQQVEQRSAEPEALSCEVDASCYSDNEKNSVARIVFENNGDFYVCSGTLLADRANDSIPYFLTANHCVGSQASAQSVESYWFYQTTSCNSGVLRSGIVHQTGGATLLTTQSANDFALLRMADAAPSGAWFSGWSSRVQGVGAPVWGFHHPDNAAPPTVKSYLRRSDGSIQGTNDSCGATGLASGYYVPWSSGTAEPGSSGSGLWNQGATGPVLIGVLSCGPSTVSCSTREALFSKFSAFFSQISSYLDPPRTLTVASVNPSSGVAITVSPADRNGTSNGNTQFTRVYNQNTEVTLIAPSPNASGNSFLKWQRDSVDFSSNASVSVTMDANHTMTAMYQLAPPTVPTAIAASNVTDTSFLARWGSAARATGYKLDVSTDSSFATFLTGYNNLDVGSATSWSVTGLNFGATYYYRVRAYNSAGTTADSNTISATPSVTGSLWVTIYPPRAVSYGGAQWNVDGGPYEASTALIPGLSVGTHVVAFKPIPGWSTPPSQNVTVAANTTTFAEGTYVQQSGSLQVTITPVGAIAAGAQWQLDGGTFQESGGILTNVPGGEHTVAFKTVNGWITPPSQTVKIDGNVTTNSTGVYSVAPGSVQVSLGPPGAVAAGALWRLDNGAYQNSGITLGNITPGNHTVSFREISGWITPATQTVTVTSSQTVTATGIYAAVPPPAVLGNISTRGFVGTGDFVMIGGFVINGTQPKKVIIRAKGGSLIQYGLPSALLDPTLSLYSSSTQIASNDDWADSQKAEIEAAGMAPEDRFESGIIRTLNPGGYTAIVRGRGDTTGIALVEVFELDDNANAKLINLSTRGLVQTGDGVMIGGFVIRGTQPLSVLVRAKGPSLSALGVPSPLFDPTLTLHDAQGNVIANNDNWKDTQAAAIQATGNAPTHSSESAIVQTLPPGNYTAIVRGTNNSSGSALVEVFSLK